MQSSQQWHQCPVPHIRTRIWRFGELIAFVIGWDLILEYALQAATVSAGWSGYFNKLLEGFGLHLPVELTRGIRHHTRR